MTTLIERTSAYLDIAHPQAGHWSRSDVIEWLKGDTSEVRAVKAAHQIGCANSVITDEIEALGKRQQSAVAHLLKSYAVGQDLWGAVDVLARAFDQPRPPLAPRSVLQDWVQRLSTRQQGVLILALRGPDGSIKESAAKPIVRTLRALVMVSGRERAAMDFGVAWRDDTFMNTVHIQHDRTWLTAMDAFFAEMDSLNLHFFQHLIHAFAVAGIHFPVDSVRNRCWGLYLIACRKLHVHPESAQDITHRLRDGVREEDTPDEFRASFNYATED